MSNYRKTMTEALREMYPLNEGTIDKVKEIASKKQAMKIDGVMVDSFTASAISQIYDKVNDANKKKMEKLPITKLANLAMKMMQKNDYVPEGLDLDEGTKQVLAHGGKGKYKVTKDGDKIEIKFGGKVVGTADFDRGADSFFVSIKGERGQKSFDDAQAIADYFAKNKIEEELDLDEGKMSQLHQYIKDKKSPEEIAKLMKLDVKTIKSLMSSHHPEEVEESAASDARRAMRRDKDFSRRDSADDDTDATADDVKGASKNIMMQMRKAQSLNGRFDVEFADKKKVKIPAKMAIAVQQKYNSMKRPAEKEKFQAKVGKSYKDMLSALKEELQPKKESVLDRIDKKI